MDIHINGGGIHFTVDYVHQASIDQLHSSLFDRLSAMLRCGTTLVEAIYKSSYGLNFDNEYKMLEVIERAKRSTQFQYR